MSLICPTQIDLTTIYDATKLWNPVTETSKLFIIISTKLRKHLLITFYIEHNKGNEILSKFFKVVHNLLLQFSLRFSHFHFRMPQFVSPPPYLQLFGQRRSVYHQAHLSSQYK